MLLQKSCQCYGHHQERFLAQQFGPTHHTKGSNKHNFLYQKYIHDKKLIGNAELQMHNRDSSITSETQADSFTTRVDGLFGMLTTVCLISCIMNYT